jgi:hypothetical protein
MTPFEPDGVYNSIPYRVLPDSSIEAMMPGGLVKFKNMDQFVASCVSAPANTNVKHSIMSYDVLGNTNERNVNVPASARPLDYYLILLEAIKTTKQNSAQLRALVYERARFNLKRDALFGYSSMGLADLVQQINEFEIAVARVEANSIDDQPSPAYREQGELLDPAHAKSSNSVQILPPRPIRPLYAGLNPIQWMDNFQHARLSEEFVRHVRFANKFIGIAFLGMAFIGTVIITVMLWPSPKVAPQIEIVNKLPKTGDTAVKHSSPSEDTTALIDSSSKVPFPLPTSFGIYVLSNNNLTELEALPINIPDPRIALSAEIKTPSTTTISDTRPAFILFRRDLLNNAPQKIMLRVIARIARETKIVDGKAGMTNIEGAWRIRNISRELKISPIAGQREMVMARVDDDVSLAAGRYALVLNKIGYDFTITGPVQSPEFCLEGFETTNGSVFTQCRTP